MAKKSLKDMKFDAVVMNQPYGTVAGKKAAEVSFIEEAKKVADKVICICPTHNVSRMEVEGIKKVDFYNGDELFGIKHGAVAIMEIENGYEGDIEVDVKSDTLMRSGSFDTKQKVKTLSYNSEAKRLAIKLSELQCDKISDAWVTRKQLEDDKFVVAFSYQFMNENGNVYPQFAYDAQIKSGLLSDPTPTGKVAKEIGKVGADKYLQFNTKEEAEEYYNFLKYTSKLHDALYHHANSGAFSTKVANIIPLDINKAMEIINDHV